MVDDQTIPVYAVTSAGLWAIRADIEKLTGGIIRFWPLCAASSLTGFIGWGSRRSGLKARQLARHHAKSLILLEDGFLKSYAPGRKEPAHSYVIDRSGMFFDVSQANDLSVLLDEPVEDAAHLARARRAMDFIRSNQISKYNNSPLIGLAQAGIVSGRPCVLLVDQVAGDASIKGALADEASFATMLTHAKEHYPDAELVVRTHPAAGEMSLLGRAAKNLSIPITVPGRMNPWPLLEQAEAVYTVSSQLGFEALMAGRTVHCFGATYYSHRGLTDDHVAINKSIKAASLETVFHRAYIDYSHYLDLHDRSSIALETALEQIMTVRDHRNAIPRQVYTGGLSPWKRKALEPFTTGPSGKPRHCHTLKAAVDKARAGNGMVALWGSGVKLPEAVLAVRFEDGFIRSRGLGANLALPCSLAMDDEHPYYDARGPSRLERILGTHEFPPDLVERAGKLVALIIELGVSKYNVGAKAEFPEVEDGKVKILVPGQVEKDASIRFGSPEIKTNFQLVAAVRALFPQAYIVYKEHPDVTSGMRSGGVLPEDADIIVRQGNINDWIGWCDRIETMTSLTGFEALLRGRRVGVHGMPFYAGWGLTDDRMEIARRGRRLTMAQLAAAALILYPAYIHPLSGLPCRPEDLVAAIAANRTTKTSPLGQFKLALARSINRAAVKFRDRRT